MAAIECERLNRVKHSNKFPVEAINYCLKERGVALTDVDRIAYYWGQDYLDWANADRFLNYEKPRPYANALEIFAEIFHKHFGVNVNDRLRFVNHHTCHALSAAAFSGFEEGLVCSVDGMGDTGAGLIAEFRNGSLRTLAEIPNGYSLGQYYARAIKFIGYNQFDEYKVMGLAPYGDPSRFADIFAKTYQLEEGGKFGAWSPWLNEREMHEITRVSGEPFLQIHKDWAAALQASLERIVMHCLSHYRESTGLANLALAGGVAHNCTLNGKLLTGGLFDRVFVQPAAHDAGAALGAALHVYYDECRQPVRVSKLPHVYWGTDIGGRAEIDSEVQLWSSLVDYSLEDDIISKAADLLAADAAIGWVQGRSEFGPRALGNRSILADPRPAENKGRINKMIKKREAYRPFAPTVLQECVSDYFVVPDCGDALSFMTCVVDVQPGMRDLLGAITHVDGTARVQTVAREQNSRYWDLIKAFGDRTGVPILLNTSFNNNEEPIVESVEDAIVCYLTTDLNYLVVGDYLVRKKQDFREKVGSLVPSLPRYVWLSASSKPGTASALSQYQLRTTYDDRKDYDIDAKTFRVLERIDGKTSLDCLVDGVAQGDAEARGALVASMLELWSRRLIRLRPRASSAQ